MSRNVPNCNRSFLLESLLQNKRLDNRTFFDFRDLQINFGQTFGSCFVQLGNTIVFASTEATLDEPRISRPSEGRFKVIINICAGGKDKWLKHIERSQPTEAVQTTRLLEKIMNRINVIDLESLCLITGKIVWCISTRIVLLNFDGNLIEAASIATIASLMHFKRPDATVTSDSDIIIHSFEERNPLPLVLFHYPICVSFQFMDPTLLKKILNENQDLQLEQHNRRVLKSSQLIICDPTSEEEEFIPNVLIICANVYREIVAIQSIGPLSLDSFQKQLLKICADKAFDRVEFVTNYIRKCLERHKGNEKIGSELFNRYGFLEAIRNGDLTKIQNDFQQSIIDNEKNSLQCK
ncbi:Laminin subunit beta-1 [Sarcoptes scabiei]|nr:Laminin subunit beta-1 [Sarcoptes scabiei]